MPTLLVIRQHPIEPISGDTFTTFLDGLSIDAHQLSFNDPTGTAKTGEIKQQALGIGYFRAERVNGNRSSPVSMW